MKRLQGIPGARDPDEEKRKVREGVISNFIVFGMICGAIKIVPVLMKYMPS